MVARSRKMCCYSHLEMSLYIDDVSMRSRHLLGESLQHLPRIVSRGKARKGEAQRLMTARLA